MAKYIGREYAIINCDFVLGELYDDHLSYNNNIYSLSDVKLINKYEVILDEKYFNERVIDVVDHIFAKDKKEAMKLITEKYKNLYNSKIKIKEVYQTWQ